MNPTLIAAAVLALLGCAAQWDARSRQLCDENGCFTVGELPTSWRVIHQEQSEIGFFDDGSGAAIQGNATCRTDADVAPLATLTRHLLLGYSERMIRSETLVALDRREALHTVIDARLDGVAIVLDLYVLKRNNCIYDLSLAAPPGSYLAAQRDFARFVVGFVGTRRL